MANLHKYVESSQKTGYYLLEGYSGKVITYQMPDFAEKLLLNLGYRDGNKIAKEVFYILINLNLIYTNQSGIEPVESLEDLPEFDSDEISSLSAGQREQLVNMLLDHGGLTSAQRDELTSYAESRDTGEQHEGSSVPETDSSSETFDSRIKDYDDYMIAVDIRRLLKPAVEQLDVEEEQECSKLLTELEAAGDRQSRLYEKCKEHPKNLRAYRNEQGVPDGVRVLEKNRLNEHGLPVPTGDGNTIKVSYNIPAKDHDVVVPENWDISPIRPRNADESGDIRFEDLPGETQERLMDRARKEVLRQVVGFLEEM